MSGKSEFPWGLLIAGLFTLALLSAAVVAIAMDA